MHTAQPVHPVSPKREPTFDDQTCCQRTSPCPQHRNWSSVLPCGSTRSSRSPLPAGGTRWIPFHPEQTDQQFKNQSWIHNDFGGNFSVGVRLRARAGVLHHRSRWVISTGCLEQGRQLIQVDGQGPARRGGTAAHSSVELGRQLFVARPSPVPAGRRPTRWRYADGRVVRGVNDPASQTITAPPQRRRVHRVRSAPFRSPSTQDLLGEPAR
jgi:hypothetical protein